MTSLSPVSKKLYFSNSKRSCRRKGQVFLMFVNISTIQTRRDFGQMNLKSCSTSCTQKLLFRQKKNPECSQGSKQVAKVLFGGKHGTKRWKNPKHISNNSLKPLTGRLAAASKLSDAGEFVWFAGLPWACARWRAVGGGGGGGGAENAGSGLVQVTWVWSEEG